MKKAFYLLICLFLVACGTESTTNISSNTSGDPSSNAAKTTPSVVKLTAQSIISGMDKAKYKEGELLVKFKPDVMKASAKIRHQTMGVRVVKNIPLINVDHVKLPQGLTVKDAIIEYMKDPNVEYAEPNYILHMKDNIPWDPFFEQQWALRNVGQYANGTPGADISAPKAWDISIGSYNNVFVAVVDSGIDHNHPDLFNNVIAGYNFIDENENTLDDVGHGTHVAGILGAFTSNGIGMSGVMWQVRMIPVKVCSKEEECPTDAIANGITYAVQHYARIINVSLGTDPGGPNPLTLYEAVSTANNAGMLVIAAAGNENNNNDITPVYPASYDLPNVISVAATDQHDMRAPFSNYGYKVHVAAPGVYILSTIPLGKYPSSCISSPYAQFAFCDGTSMSAPHVSGLAGLILSYYYYFDYSQVRGTVLKFVDNKKPTLDGWIWSGGRINAYRSLASLLLPEELSATGKSSSEMNVKWTDKALGEDNYRIERKSGSGSYTVIATLPYNSDSYLDTGLSEGGEYTYRITPFNYLPNPPSTELIKTYGYSSEITGKTTLRSPSNLFAFSVTISEIKLTWENNSGLADGFKIERKKTDETVWGEISQATGDSYTDSGLAPATTYSYRIKAFSSAAGESDYSNEASAETKKTASSGSSGGGGCSIGARQNMPTAIADLAILLIPLIVIVLYRRKRV
ncbi:MAG: S8 family serine peptidase [Thermodesulfovibrionales bacterium]